MTDKPANSLEEAVGRARRHQATGLDGSRVSAVPFHNAAWNSAPRADFSQHVTSSRLLVVRGVTATASRRAVSYDGRSSGGKGATVGARVLAVTVARIFIVKKIAPIPRAKVKVTPRTTTWPSASRRGKRRRKLHRRAAASETTTNSSSMPLERRRSRRKASVSRRGGGSSQPDYDEKGCPDGVPVPLGKTSSTDTCW